MLELQNGDTWQQDAVKSRYAYGYRPKVSVWQEGSHYYMEVSGMYELIHVRRVQMPLFRQSRVRESPNLRSRSSKM